MVKEHVVPLKVIMHFLRKLADEGNIQTEKIAKILDDYTVFATITKEEDAKLRKAGLTSKMPKEFEEDNELDADVFARYKHTSIELE